VLGPRFIMMKNSILLTLVCGITALCGCGGKNGFVGGGQGNSVFLKSITMTPANPTMTLAVSPQPPATQQFVVIGQYNVGNPKDVTDQMTWISADPKVATLDTQGVATATGSGRVIITTQIFEPATQKTLQATTVLSVVPQLTSIAVSPTSAQIAKDTTQQFTATGSYNDGTQADITALVDWNSSQPAANVSSSPGTQGRALGISPGPTNITASLGPLTSSAALLTVTDANLVALAVTPANSTVPLANSQQFVATGTFDDGTKQNISVTATWISSNPSIARVTSAGLLTGLGLGTADITVGMGAVSDTTTATVDASSVSKITVVPVDKIADNTSSQMRAVAIFKDGGSLDATNTPGIAWSSSDSSVATIAANSGLANAKSPGSATISAKLGSSSGSTTLNVSDAAIQSLAVAPNQATIAPGTSQNIIALATFVDTAGEFQQDVSSVAAWLSDNAGVATVSYESGLQELARGVTTGVASISASFSDAHGNLISSSAALNVRAATLSGITVAPGNAGVTFGGGHQFIATGTFSDGTQQDLTRTADWSANNASIATVSPFGFAAASGPGQTTIAATLNSQNGSSSMLVNPGALVKIDICPADTADPLSNCPPLDPFSPPPPISFPKIVPYGLIAIGTFTDGSREDLTSSVRWTTSNPSTATISNDPGIPGYITGVTTQGVVTGVASGHVTLTATAGAVSGNSDVIVTDATPAFLTVTPMNGTVQQGLTQQLTVLVTFIDNPTEIVTPYVRWTSSDPSVVVVYPGGLAYPRGPGLATVTANIDGAAGSTTLTVR
jgi:trimeric autotransporter adhesin